jgi:hypothetical protein
MTHVFPCAGCPLRDGCDQRQEFAQRAKASGAGSISLRCSILKDAVRPGRRVQIMTPEIEYDRYGEVVIRKAAVSATITTIGTKYQFASVVDPGQLLPDDGEERRHRGNVRFRRRQPHYRIVRFLDEPDAVLCSNGNVQRDGVCDTYDGTCFCK